MDKSQTLYGLNDVTLIPERFTNIKHRSECDPYHNTNGWYNALPIFVSPMSCIINEYNWEEFDKQGLSPIIPRSIPLKIRYKLTTKAFVAYGIDEFKEFIKYHRHKFTPQSDYGTPDGKYFVCIDIANGHMRWLYDLCKEAKEIFKDNIVIMTGNIANPETYLDIASFKCIDYIRIGIGSGNVCTTSANTAIHYPMASLIMECRKIKNNKWQYPEYKFPDIVADGGFQNFDQIIKALALGADWVMMGQIFAKADTACGKLHKRINWKELIQFNFKKPFKYYREYYGMSTKKAQKEFGGEGKKTAEGIVKLVEIEYTLHGWVDNFMSFLKSAMSYTNCKTLQEFIGGPRIGLMTNTAYISYFK